MTVATPPASNAERARRAAALSDVAEAWLYRLGDPAAAADAASAALALTQTRPGTSDRAGAGPGRELRYLRTLALSAGERWQELGDVLATAAAASGADVALIAEAAHVLYDRLDDRGRAATLVARFGDPRGSASLATLSGPALVHGYRVLGIALDIAGASLRRPRSDGGSGTRVDPTRLEALERQRLAMLGRLDDTGAAAAETAAVEVLLAETTGTRDPDPALDTYARLAGVHDPAAPPPPAWSACLAAMLGYRLARDSATWDQAAAFQRALHAGAGAGALSAAHGWRAAEILDARVGDRDPALAAWQPLADDGPAVAEQATRARERWLLDGDPDALLEHLTASAERAGDDDWARTFLRRAAAVAESRLGDLERAAALQTEVATAGSTVDYEHLLRLHRRRGDRPSLIATYRALIEKLRDPRSGTACLCAVGALEWAQGDGEAAEEAFSAAARQSPRDPISRLALAALYRAAERRRELVTVLARLVELVTDQALTVELLRELGLLYASEFNNTRRARETLDRALALIPDDAATLHGMALLSDRSQQWDEAIALRRRALAAAEAAAAPSVTDGAGAIAAGAPPFSPGALWLEIGHIEEEQHQDDDAALAAYVAAVEHAPGADALPALEAQERIYRRREQKQELLQVLEAQLGQRPPPERQLEIQLDIAMLTGAGKTGEHQSDVAMAAYMNALSVEPGNEIALAGVAEIGRKESRWELVAAAFRAAPATIDNLRILGEALAELSAWSTLVEVRKQQIELTTDEGDKAALLHDLAELHLRRLGDAERAVACYQQSITHGRHGSEEAAASRRALNHLLADLGRWDELAVAYERELDALPDDDYETRTDLLMRLGQVLRDRLERHGDAISAYEEALELDPSNLDVLSALADLYEIIGSEEELLRVLSARALISDDGHERCEVYKRIAEIKQGRDDVDGAIIAYRQGFEAEPANREMFKDMERLCYAHQRWNDAMALYNNAIERVEGGLQGAYRLGDLYERRAQIQLQHLDRVADAVASYQRVIELDPDSDTAIGHLDSLLSHNADWPTLMAVYETRAQLTTDDDKRVAAYRRMASLADQELSDSGQAADIYERLLEVRPTDQGALDTLERHYQQDKDWERLVNLLELRLAHTASEETAIALLRRIAQECEEKLRDPQRAAHHYRRILERSPGNKDALEALGRIYESTEQWTEFIEVTRRQIRVTSDRNIKALLYFKCGSVMEAKFGKEEDAIRYYDAAIKTSPSCLPAVHGLRDLYRRREDWPRVIQTLELEVKLWQDKKERAGVSAQIGRIYATRLSDPQMALHYYESALAIDPDCMPANQALFEHYFESQDWARAKPLAQSLVQKAMREGDPSTRSEFYRRYGIVSYQTGDVHTGADSLVTALEIQPTNIAALDTLGALARDYPDAYSYEETYRELDKIYKKRDDAESLQARVRIAQAVLRGREGDLDGAAALYEEATDLCNNDFAVLAALVEFRCSMRRFGPAVEAIERFLATEPPPSPEDRVQALLRQAEIHADCDCDPVRAIAVLEQVVALDPEQQDAYYRLAQERFVLARYQDARAAIDRAIELAAAPGKPVSPEILARYYYYRGRIIETDGDRRSAASQYRRAAEYDPTYAPPVLALARRAIEQQEQRQAETLLINAAHSAMGNSGVEAAIPLQRGLARILLGAGDHKAAIEAYRGILNVRPHDSADRYALAAIYAEHEAAKAVLEAGKILQRDLYHAPTYHLLVKLFMEQGEVERAMRVFSVMELLGFAGGAQPSPAAAVLLKSPREPLRHPLTDDMRRRVLATGAHDTPLSEVFAAIAEEAGNLFARSYMGDELTPITPTDNEVLSEMGHAYGVTPEVYVGRDVPRGVVMFSRPRPLVVFDRRLVVEEPNTWRFLLGWAFDIIRGDYALLFALDDRQRGEFAALVRSLLAPPAERPTATKDFLQRLSDEAVQVLDEHAGQQTLVDVDDWLEGLANMAKRAGLFACDDLDAAIRTLARMNGESVDADLTGTAGLGAVLGGADLLRFYVSEEYHRLRKVLSANGAPGGA
ncbi:hypothetical protein [Haliangium sp.]|uniref:hypothetical protein n=1 Tax=Haliangium sp. TaxID=2663208 RepID=UPI003D0E88D0